MEKRTLTDQTFENFVVTEENRFAFHAAQAVAVSPGEAYNPLFLYGSTGMGKTYLLHAIEHQIKLEETPLWKPIYITAEQFVTQWIDSIRENRISTFEKGLQAADLLLFDDLDLLSGKTASQEFLFTLIEYFLTNKKQVVFTSALPPRDQVNFSDRLKSRFTWGLTAELGFSSVAEFTELFTRKLSIPLTPEQIEEIGKQSLHHPGEIVGQIRQTLACQELMDIQLDEDFWERVLTAIEKQISPGSYNTWLKTTTAIYEEGKIKVSAPNEFASDWLSSQYLPLIAGTVEKVTGKTIPVEIQSTEGTKTGSQKNECHDDLQEIKDLFKQSLELQRQMVELLKEKQISH